MFEDEIEENEIPVLVLPEPIPVKPPKFEYAQYEKEEKPLRDAWEKQFALSDKCQERAKEIKIELPPLRKELAKIKKAKDVDKYEKESEIDRLNEEIDELKDEYDEQLELVLIHKEKGEKIIKPWHREQKRRWGEGHDNLSGIHYFYLTQMKIKDAEGNLIRPFWRDVDEVTLNEFLTSFENEIDLYVFKRREIGLSSVFGGLIPLWISIMFAGSTSLMTSADLTRATDLLANKFIAQHASMDDRLRSNRISYDKSKGAKLGEIDEDGNPTGNIADIVCRQTSQDKNDVTNLEGARAKYGFLDELFLHPYPEEVRASVESCLMSGLGRVGIMVAGGSAGSVSRLGLKQARTIWESAKHGQVRCLFLSGAMGITSATIRDLDGKKVSEENFCINGHSDVERATAYILWWRKILDLNPDKRPLNSFIKRYPIDIDEVFQSDEVGVIPKDVADKIPDQETELRNNPRNIRSIKIKEVNGKMSFENDPKGAWIISQAPEKGMTYIMGTDCIPMLMSKEESTLDPEDTDHSMHCTVIKCIELNTYVGIYLRRTSDIDLIYGELKDAQALYGETAPCQNMIERNSAQLLYDRYKFDNNLNSLAYQPRWIGSKAYKKNSVRGVYKDNHNRERIYSAGFDHFRDHMENVDFPIILEQLRVFGTANTDVMDAIFMAEVFHRGMAITDGQRASFAMKATYKEVAYTTTDNKGRTVVRYRKEMDPKYRSEHDAMMENMKPLGI